MCRWRDELAMTVMQMERRCIAVSADDLQRVRTLYDAGDFLGAYEVAREIGPLAQWGGTAATLIAGRLAGQLGSQRLRLAMFLRAWRNDPDDAEACYYRARATLTRRSPLYAWRFLQRIGPLEGAENELRSDWLASHAIVLGALRDFDRAEAYMAEAERLAPHRAWLGIERSALFEMEDRYADALDASRRALDLCPWYSPAVQSIAHLLQLMDRDPEADALLSEACSHAKSGLIAAQLAAIRFENRRYLEAMRCLDLFESLSPLLDAPTNRWLAGRRSDAAYHLGDVAAAACFARQSREPFFLALAERIQAEGACDRRVRLDVGFIRQHHQTCAPATLTAIAQFWGKDTDHLELAGEICYDGTPDHRERSWAETNGWIVREFTVTWNAAVALLDRGIPSTLTTVEADSAHLQAVIGYDARRGTLLIRDPTLPQEAEAFAQGFLDRYRSVGPRGMAMVPRDRAALLEGLELPEAGLYDRLHEMQVRLHSHDREAAALAFAALRSDAPDHRLTHHARRLLGIYDADVPAILLALDALSKAFPEDVNLRLARLSCLRELGRREERLSLCREACRGSWPDPVLRREFARELLADAREHPTAERLAHRALRARPVDSATVHVLARVAWDAGRLQEGLELYRFASCLDDKNEWLARAFFDAARHLHREEEALRVLESRVRRFGALSSLPARTLHAAFWALDRAADAAVVLEHALRLRSHDGDLLLYAAQVASASGELESAATRLEEARRTCRHGDWLRAAANLAWNRGDLGGSLKLWKQVLESEPAALDANRAVAKLLEETEGRGEASTHLRQACQRSPHNYSLHRLHIEWLRREASSEAEPVLHRLLEIHPADAWGYRELALVLSEQGRVAEAEIELEIATALEPASTSEASTRGFVLERAGRIDEAREDFREAIRRDVDNEWAMDQLVRVCDSHSQRVEALLFVGRELERQVTLGDGLLAFARRARGTLGSDGLLASLTRALDARPDLWHAWSALIHERIERDELDQAKELAQQAVKRFPLLPKLWLDLAACCRARGDGEGEYAALENALRISPGWGRAARDLSLAMEHKGNYEESRTVLERAIAHAPLDPLNHGFLADTLWRMGEKDQALTHIAQAVRLEPGYQWAWQSFVTWCGELGGSERPAELARELVAQRPGDVRVWMALARVLERPDFIEERLNALDTASAIDPSYAESYDLKAELLAESGRFDEAEAACHPPHWGNRPPVTLRGRAAWVVAQRGDLVGAMARMRSVLQDNPDYVWGWDRFVEWAYERGTKEEYLDAARTASRLSPESAIALGYLGLAQLRNGHRAGAKESFRRALKLMPSYSFAGMHLFDQELTDHELDAAGAALSNLKSHGREDDAFVNAREVQWYVAKAERIAALEALRKLCSGTSEDSEWPLRIADRAFATAGWSSLADSVYAQALERRDAAPLIGAVWAERWATRRKWWNARRIGPLLAKGSDAANQAVATYIRVLGQKRSSLLLRLCLWRHRESLRRHTVCWGTVGYALTNVNRYHAVSRWLADWPSRQNVQPWMLINLVICLRSQGRVAEASAVGRHAEKLPRDASTPCHSLWLMLDHFIDGRTEEALNRLASLDPANFDVTNRYLYGLAQAMNEAQRADESTRRRATLSARRTIVSLNRSTIIPSGDHQAVLRTFRRAVRRLTTPLGPWLGWLLKLESFLVPPRRATRP
jgi:tetratricopeptide (TPR) repeat protein